MKRNIKLAAALMSIAVIAAGVTGCSKDTDTKANDSAENVSAAADVDYSKYITLGTYKGIEVEKESTEVTDEEIEAQIKADLETKAEKQEVTDRDTVENGDVANIDYKGLLNGEAFEGGTAEGYDLVIGSNTFIEGFEEQLVGAKVGEKTELNVTFPENYMSTDLAGKDVVFEVKVNSISSSVVPEFNDEFVQANSDFNTTDEYRENIVNKLKEQNEASAEYNMQGNVWTEVKDNCEVKDYPTDLVDKYKEQINAYYSGYASQYEVSIEDFMTNYMGISLEDYAKEMAKEEMIFKTIVKNENLALSDKEFNEKLQDVADQYGYESPEAVLEGSDKAAIEESFLWETMMTFLVDNALIK